MLVTDLAYRDMEERAGGIADLIARIWHKALRRPSGPARGPEHRPASTPYLTLVREPEVHALVEPLTRPDHLRWRRHPQLRTAPPLPDPEAKRRSARSAAIQGVFLARGSRFEDARAAFTIAAADDAIDLTSLPGFWDLSRGGMLAAVGAYEDVGRFRDAASLAARIRTRYRPRTVSDLPTIPARRQAHSGS